MTTGSLGALVLPPNVWAAVLKLLTSIEEADSAQTLNLAAHYAQGFVLGIETSTRFTAADIKALYLGFDAAALRRGAALRQV